MKHLLLSTAALFSATVCPGAIIASGLQGIVIGTTFDGVYLNLETGATTTTDSGNWHINAFFGGEGIANSPTFQPVRATVALDSSIIAFSQGAVIDGSRSYAVDYAGSDSHIGSGAGQFANNTEGYLGFKLVANGGTGEFFGWMRVVLSRSGQTGLIREWAYDDSGSAIQVGAVPEPSTFAFLGAASSLLMRRRRLKGTAI